MSVEKCAQTILKAIAKRKREVVMKFQSKFGQLGKLIVPNVSGFRQILNNEHINPPAAISYNNTKLL